MAGNIVAEWLRSLHLGQYAESFIDNGYDDLEICKQVGDPDLDAIGVFNPVHRSRLLQSVKTLREEGAASVYFTLEESATVHEECLCDNVSARSSRTSSGRCSDKDAATSRHLPGTTSPTASSSAESAQELTKYLDEYEEGKAELVKIPRIQLKLLLRDKLTQDGIRLSCQPYSTSDGERGYLEGLASRYADTFNTHYGDVLEHLEELRRREWDEMSPRIRVLGAGTPESPPAPAYSPTGGTTGLTTSQSQPIYVPGKYSPSSCLSDKEEDEIYGFGYGVFGKQMMQRQQQKLLIQGAASSVPTSQQPLMLQQYHNYQSCLSPRSAYFYEFPPTDGSCQGTNKKRTTFSRFLRGLKTSHRKEKHGGSSPRHGRASRGIPQRVDTPDSVLQSGLEFGPDIAQHTVLRSMVDPRDYDRLRHLQMNGGASNSFEETIHRLKIQEALKKKEKFHREHEEILRDIRQGLLQLGKEGVRGPLSGDDTYMYDEDARVLGPGCHDRGHWYDEPPYESDPEDFLMGSNSPVPTATIQNGRVCFTLNLRNEPRGEGVISLRSAGDISLPRDTPGAGTPRGTPRRGLILPQAGYPPTIIPLTHSRSSRDRESRDYAGSDVQSVSSRLSTLSVETSRSEQQEGMQLVSPQFLPHSGSKSKQFRKIGYFKSSEDGLSPSQSSDYEDQEELENSTQQIATVHVSSDGRSAGVAGLVGKVRGLRQDVQRKISKLRNESADQQRRCEQAFPCSASSVESLPSGSGSSTQALVRAGSNHSSISAEEREPSPTSQIIGRARALVDYVPSPYDKDALKFKKGDIIDIISMNASGLWKGMCQNRIGTFKFINVELLSERSIKARHEPKWHRNIKGKPASVEELLQKINMQEHISVFVLNGYEDLELFKEIEPADLDYLGIVNSEHRAKILTAVQLLHDLESGSEGDVAGSSSEGDDQNRGLMLTASGTCSPFGRRQFPRDSGCYDASMKSTRLQQHASPQEESDTSDQAGFCDNTNNLDSVVQQCSSEILARVKQAQNSTKLKDECVSSYHPNIPVLGSVTSSPSIDKLPRAKDSYVGAQGQTMLFDPMKRNVLNRGSNRKPSAGASSSAVIEDSCEADQKLTVVKYVVGGSSDLGLGCESGNIASSLGRGGCLSEKSSDSGVSSSSLSSANTRDARSQCVPRANANSPTRGFGNFSSNCSNRASPTTITNKNNSLILQGPESNSFQ